MKKTFYFFYIILFIFFVFLFIKFSDKFNALVFSKLKEISPSDFKSDKLLFIDGEFEIKSFNALFDKLKTAENSVILLLPQIFNMKIGDYLESINPDEIKNLKDDYNNFVFKIAEMPNLLPVVFVYNEKDIKQPFDLTKFYYFNNKNKSFEKFNYVKIVSKKLWQIVNDVAFYTEYESYPFFVPVIYNYNDGLLINAALEAIKKYYKLPKSQIKLENNNIIIGNIINFSLIDNGKIIAKPVKNKPKIFSINEILSAEKKLLDDKIIIIKSNNNTIHTMLSLGALVESIMEKDFIKYDAIYNYIAAFILCVFLLFLFKDLKFIWGFILFIFVFVLEAITAIALIKIDIYYNYFLFFIINSGMFILIYVYKGFNYVYSFNRRKELMQKYIISAKIDEFIRKNKDIKIMNYWLKTEVIYVVFDENEMSLAENVKNSFEKLKQMIYNNKYNCFIKINRFNEFCIVFLDEIDLKLKLELLFKIRENLDFNFNMIINNSEIYLMEYRGEINLIDKNLKFKLICEMLEKKKYILISNEDIQKYINLIKFQKISSNAGITVFNVAGER